MPVEEKTYREPRPGDFVPADQEPRPPRKEEEEGEKKTEAAPKTNIPASEVEQQAAERAQLYEEMVEGLTPIEDYQAFLKEQKISEEKAQDIVDNLFTKGFHSEKVTLTKRVSATLRTREHADTLRLQMALEVQRPIYNHVMQELTARYNLAASLERFGDTTFEHPEPGADKEKIEKLFDERLQFVERMADPAFYKLTDALVKLDRTVAAVMREGVAENF
jgi:hypothetical protein